MKIAVLSDIHANIEALEAVLAAMPADTDEILLLGDVVDYGASPNECVARQRSLGAAVTLMGNHDLAVMQPDIARDFNPVAATAAAWTAQRLLPEHRDHLASLQAAAEHHDMLLVHASPRDPLHEYVFDSWTAGSCFASFGQRICLYGHTHTPAVWTLTDEGTRAQVAAEGTIALPEGRLLINPGSVGQPRDGDWRAAFLRLDLDRGLLEFRRAEYPVAQAQRRILEAGLPSMLAERLPFGL